MPVKARVLTPLDVKRATHPGGKAGAYRMAVGGVDGLLLSILPSGHKQWILRYRVGPKRREMGLGPFPEVGLADARDKARIARDRIREGFDPVAERKAARAALAADQRRSLTFADAFKEWHKAKNSERPEKSQLAIASQFARYVTPVIGALDVENVSTQDIARILSPIWIEKHETAQKVRSRVEAVLSWATVSGHRTGDNPARWRGNLKELLAAPTEKGGNFPAVAVAELSGWWKDLAGREGTGAAALRFLTLCASRSGEVRGATWDEIDLDAAMWAIPATRMKAGAEHRVPLAPVAVALLRALPRMKGNALVFPAARGGMLSDATLSAVMRRMHEDEVKAGRTGWLDRATGRPAVPHGLRSTFRDWCAERGVDRDLAEIALAHTVGSAVERSYRRTDMIERRRALMVSWSDFIAGNERSVVVEFPTANRG